MRTRSPVGYWIHHLLNATDSEVPLTIKARYAALLEENAPAHRRAVDRLEALESSGITRGEVLGDSARREFLAAADAQVDAAELDAAELKQRVQKLYERAQVLLASKRQAILRVGELIVHCNRFGVSTFVLPLDILGGRWASQRSTPDFDGGLSDAIGAVVDGRDRGDRLYNYSACRP